MPHQFGEDFLSYITCEDNTTRLLHGWSALNTKAIALCIHGGMSHAGDFQNLGDFLKTFGITTVGIDLHGHSKSPDIDIKSFNYLTNDVTALLSWVKTTYPNTPIFIVGHSMGGLIGTHLGIEKFRNESQIAGYIFSSPYWINAIPVSWYLQKIANLMSIVAPKIALPVKPFTHVLTHDQEMTNRIIREQKDNIRGTKPSFRFAASLIKAQNELTHIDKVNALKAWNKPMLVLLAGEDYLADTKAALAFLKNFPENLVSYSTYEDNFHENFNEINRNEIFKNIAQWIIKFI
jgi:alpha-beta hydrolase superfamily lysophospholipase